MPRFSPAFVLREAVIPCTYGMPDTGNVTSPVSPLIFGPITRLKSTSGFFASHIPRALALTHREPSP